MMARLMDMPDVEFHFTGDGWPGPPRHVPEGRMQDFYRAMDYILVPSLYEGGPMCVPEALACGIPVIAPDVGWVNSFPYIPYPKGDTDALRSLLQSLTRPKLDLAKAAAGHTWQQWGQAHAALFRKVWSGYCRTSPVRPKTALSRASVVQVLHGGEAISQGGPSVRVPQTARRLAAVCRQSDLRSGTGQIRSADIGHFYNIWQPDTALTTAMALKRRVRRLVFSPILLNLSQRAFWEDDMTRILAATPAGPMRLRAALPQLQRRYAATLADEALALRGAQPVPGFAAKLRACIALADQTVFLSEAEKALAQGLTGTDTAHFPVLPNPVDTDFFMPGHGAGSALAIRLDKEFGLPPGHPFLLAVGRVEPRKNQLMMAEAARRAGVPLIIAGHTGSQAYADLVAEAGGGTTSLIGRVAPGSRDLLWLYQNCAAFLSFSWAEGASLATLEAAACSAPLVLTDLSGEQGYFGEMARYTGPLATDDAVAAIRAAIGVPPDRQKQHRYIAARYGWDAHLAGLSVIYEALL
jgi:glycosyltransferase involved in cell wall biosynthesis